MNKKQKLVSENPYYGLEALFAMYHNKTKNISSYLVNAWNEAKDSELYKALFHVICFSIGDITNRHHNIFGKSKIEQGGESMNESWIVYLQWLIKHDPNQFVRFIPLIVEYVGLRELVTWQIRTSKKSKKIESVWGLLGIIQTNKICYDGLINYLIKSINGNNPFIKHQIAKYVKIPRHSKRILKDKQGVVKGKRNLQPNTTAKMQVYGSLVSTLSERMSWLTTVKETHVEYTGYRNWQKQYNQDLEFVLFSTHKINEFDKEQFTNWLNSLPSGARYRVQRRLFDHNSDPITKWSKFAKWFREWEASKKDNQSQQRVLELKEKTQGLTEVEKETLYKVKKDAKVTTGAKPLYDYIDGLINGKANQIAIDAIVSKTTFNVPILPIVDISGSMTGRPIIIARLLATLALLKNPTTHENLLFTFATNSDCITDGNTGVISTNRFMTGQSTTIKKLIDREASFITNFNNLSGHIHAKGGNTNISGMAVKIKQWVDSASTIEERNQRIEQINDYQVFLVISDGDKRLCHLAA